MRLLVIFLATAISAGAAFAPRAIAGARRLIGPNRLVSGSSTLKRDELPDYGKTSVNVDEHVLEERHRQWQRKDLFGSTLIDQTLEEMESNPQQPQRTKEEMTKEERLNRRRALDNMGIPSFRQFVIEKTKQSATFQRKVPEIFQLNIGLYCNQACGHCHVESSPLRTEMMSAETAARCLDLLKSSPSITTLDITGGAPELNANFRYLVEMARQLRPDIDIIDRCNLTVLQEPGQEDLVDFLKKNRVHIIASLPCYTAPNVDKQRGRGVFDRSIAALLALNEAGYGRDPTLQIDLVYNPLGGYLPPEQTQLELKYKEELQENFGVLFNSLFTITNMPIKRFADFLHQRDELQQYLELLVRNFNGATLENLMCRDTVSVGYDGKVCSNLRAGLDRNYCLLLILLYFFSPCLG
jgi:radical SAM/Cys-rich protein